jgi:hypothetical protein
VLLDYGNTGIQRGGIPVLTFGELEELHCIIARPESSELGSNIPLEESH